MNKTLPVEFLELPKTVRPIGEAVDELVRETNVRIRCFPRWIDDGRVSKTDAKDRLERIQSALTLLQWLDARFEESEAELQKHSIDAADIPTVETKVLDHAPF